MFRLYCASAFSIRFPISHLNIDSPAELKCLAFIYSFWCVRRSFTYSRNNIKLCAYFLVHATAFQLTNEFDADNFSFSKQALKSQRIRNSLVPNKGLRYLGKHSLQSDVPSQKAPTKERDGCSKSDPYRRL